ncbi:translocation and assembly module lipoprotein TamL [Spirosoma arcticum]
MMYDNLTGYILYIIHHTWVKCVAIALLLSSSGCLTSQRLQPVDPILTAQVIRGNRTITTAELESLIPQKPNSRFLGLPITPKLWWYQVGARRFDRDAAVRELAAKTNEFEQQSQQLANQPKALKQLNRRFARRAKRLRLEIEEGNGTMRNLGEPPAYFSEQDARTNAAKMQRYLSDKGFFNAQTAYTLDTLRNNQIRVSYIITENAGFYLRTIAYEINDPRIDSLVRQSLSQSTLTAGDRYDSQKIAAEKVRIETALRDKGYYAFSRQYIPNPDVDTSRRSSERQLTTDSLRRPVDLYLAIRNPPGRAAHPLYRIGDVEVRVTADEPQPTAVATGVDTVRRNGVMYLLGGRSISSRLLDGKITLRPGALYSQTNYRDTQRQLFLLNQFKFVNLNFIDTTNRQLRTLITATPLDKYEATAEGGLTGLLYEGKPFPGGFGSLIFRMRNMFGGLETFEISGRYGLEAQTGFANSANTNKYVYTSQELGIISSITFPQILFPGRFRFNFNRYNPRTQISVSFNNTFRPDFRRSLLRATMAYNWQTTPAKQFSFLIADVNLINANFDTELGALFKRQLDSLTNLGNTIGLSFRRSFASGVSFAYTYNTNLIGQNRRANFFRTVVESGGTTLNLFSESQLRQFFRSADPTGLQYYKYLRFNIDYRHYVPIRTYATLAFRVNTGLVYSYGQNRTAPYEKLFFAGGSNSIRAWLPRRLGPGADYPQPSSTNPSGPAFNTDPTRAEQFLYTFEKPGDFLLEGSIELRGRLFHLLTDVNGAIFVDAGNVWRLPYSASSTKSTFRFDSFVSQIAVGTGVGLRLDFSFILIRLDGGIKVWDPAHRYVREQDGQIVDDRFILPQFSLRRLSRGPNPMVVNFGIGYPF